jgi:hypothetical protein
MPSNAKGRSTTSASPSRSPSIKPSFTRGFIVGMAIVGSAVLYGVTQAAVATYHHYPAIQEFVASVASSTSTPDDQGGNILPKELNITMFYPEELNPEQPWTIQLAKPVMLKEGVEFDGKYITDLGALGRIRGWKSGSYLIVDYFPATGQPGFGRFILQQKRSAKAYSGIVFEGTAVGPDCECSRRIIDGYTPIISVPATLTANRTVPDDIKDRIMKKRQQTLYEPELPPVAQN